MNANHWSWRALFLFAALLMILNAILWVHADRVIEDQQAYIDAGCRGRYQGETP